MEHRVKDNSLNDFNTLRIEEEEEEQGEEQEVDEEEEDEDEEDEEPVTLGFLEKPKDPKSLLRHLFPSKAGGTPAWLDPVDLPSEKSCKCDICGEPLQFLLQVYAPIANKETTFHRTLFVFMCTSMACLLQDQHEQWKRQPEKQSRCVKVFRCQLARSNPFYSSEPPRHDETDKPLGPGAPLCHWCGTWKGDKVCGGCRSTRYCSEKHQVMHWRSGHKADCQLMCMSSQSIDQKANNQRTTLAELNQVSSNALWPEFEIINEDESEFDTEASEWNCSSSLVSKSQMDATMKSVLTNFEGDNDKRSWAHFQERIAIAPEQVLRYARGVKAKPLWPMPSGQPSNADIPKCSYCNGPLCYEFQILPQLLYYFGVKNDADSLDWGTVVVYACAGSCDASVAYKEEFAWIQLSSSSPAMLP